MKMITIITSIIVILSQTLIADNRGKAFYSESSFSVEQIEDNLPLYMTYLRLNQQIPITEIEVMGGFVVGVSIEEENVYSFKIIMPFLIQDNVNKPASIRYISEVDKKITMSKIEWVFVEDGIPFGVSVVKVKANQNIADSQLYISVDNENWYSYMLYQKGLSIELVRQSPVPMPLDAQGLPIPYCEKLLQQFEY